MGPGLSFIKIVCIQGQQIWIYKTNWNQKLPSIAAFQWNFCGAKLLVYFQIVTKLKFAQHDIYVFSKKYKLKCSS